MAANLSHHQYTIYYWLKSNSSRCLLRSISLFIKPQEKYLRQNRETEYAVTDRDWWRRGRRWGGSCRDWPRGKAAWRRRRQRHRGGRRGTALGRSRRGCVPARLPWQKSRSSKRRNGSFCSCWLPAEGRRSSPYLVARHRSSNYIKSGWSLKWKTEPFRSDDKPYPLLIPWTKKMQLVIGYWPLRKGSIISLKRPLKFRFEIHK